MWSVAFVGTVDFFFFFSVVAGRCNRQKTKGGGGGGRGVSRTVGPSAAEQERDLVCWVGLRWMGTFSEEERRESF